MKEWRCAPCTQHGTSWSAECKVWLDGNHHWLRDCLSLWYRAHPNSLIIRGSFYWWAGSRAYPTSLILWSTSYRSWQPWFGYSRCSTRVYLTFEEPTWGFASIKEWSGTSASRWTSRARSELLEGPTGSSSSSYWSSIMSSIGSFCEFSIKLVKSFLFN